MKIQKNWLIVNFTHNKATIEASLNYANKSYSLTHDNNDRNVTFTSDLDESIGVAEDRAKCVVAALKFIRQELDI